MINPWKTISAAMAILELYRKVKQLRTDREKPITIAPSRKLRWIKPLEVTENQRQVALKSPLFAQGDMVLVWVNEGDLYALGTEVK